MGQRKKYVWAGTGGRGIYMFAKPLLKQFTEYCELAALFDHNEVRLKNAAQMCGAAELPLYTDYQKMLKEVNPDAVIITTRDSTHADYIVQTLAAGKRAISEKPLCVDGQQCRDILAAAKKYAKKGADCFVTHNMRYGPSITEMKRQIQNGAIGEMKSINFHENLDRKHGADYFRRWHRQKKNSGGLLIHKASHHFDALNWIAGSRPDTLVATGGTIFYGKNGPFRHKRCEGCPHAKKCDFYVDMWSHENNVKLYKAAEKEDGYIRDACVFDKEIDIEDQAGVLYKYENGIHVTYSLTAFATYEGWHIQVEGTKGRIELREVHDTKWAAGTASMHGLEKTVGQSLTLFSLKEGLKNIPIPEVEGGHGGADSGLQQDFFGRPFDAKPTDRMAPLEQAIQAVLIGHAANVSIANGSQPVRVQDFLKHG
ncbi:MAG TPA: Gfo/Idh/MocA family oxidoreductase [Planctomycetota bacterium]|nr:Gfo/Idh/MocA family oxidoreductase [Planctomycetota bacterium]